MQVNWARTQPAASWISNFRPPATSQQRASKDDRGSHFSSQYAGKLQMGQHTGIHKNTALPPLRAAAQRSENPDGQRRIGKSRAIMYYAAACGKHRCRQDWQHTVFCALNANFPLQAPAAHYLISIHKRPSFLMKYPLERFISSYAPRHFR